jgi:hypothetical protein
MKRSDAVKNIANYLASTEYPAQDVDGAESPLFLQKAEEMLQKMESLGMKPPRLPESYCQAIMSVYYGGYTYNQWEEEVEKDEKVMAAKKRRDLRD